MTMMQEISFVALSGGKSQKKSLSGSSVSSDALYATSTVVTVTTDAFYRTGPAADTVTALADGTDQFMPAGTWRVFHPSGYKLSFITSGSTGTAYLTPGA